VPNLNPQAILSNVQVLMSIIERVFMMVQVGGPMVIDMGIALLNAAMNAMDWPNAEKVLAPLEGMLEQQQQQPAMGGPAGLDPGMGGFLPGDGGAGGEMPQAMLDPLALGQF
jgi:hypothetical protein